MSCLKFVYVGPKRGGVVALYIVDDGSTVGLEMITYLR